MGKASRNPTKKPYKVRVAEKQREIEDEHAVRNCIRFATPIHLQRTENAPAVRFNAQEEDQLCWNLVIACLISVSVCFIGEYLHKRCV